jgi:hypothetical protein
MLFKNPATFSVKNMLNMLFLMKPVLWCVSVMRNGAVDEGLLPIKQNGFRELAQDSISRFCP